MTPIHLRIPTSELAALDAAAEREGRTRSSMARHIIRGWLGGCRCVSLSGGLGEDVTKCPLHGTER